MTAQADGKGACLPYRFAHDNGVALVWDGPGGPDGDSGSGSGRIVRLAAADPFAVVEARRIAGQALPCTVIEPDVFARTLSGIYTQAGIAAIDTLSPAHDLEELAENADVLDISDQAPIIALINGMIGQGARAAASDIHIEPFADRLQVRFRVDGQMREAIVLPRRLSPFLVSRIKVMARLDIAEKRAPQDGRVSLSLGEKMLDLRISILPSRHGERVVMRILDQEGARLDMSELGMPERIFASYRTALAEPNGIILVTGPTGSGKTTSLYAGLRHLNDRTRTILTVEDPVEYGLEGIGQTHINPQSGLTFASGLRAILRQDPDIVMVGEIRDQETARTAIQASLTGHLVLSTVHTNSAAAAVTRMMDMGIEPFLLASTLVGVISQRLPRRLCEQCKERYVCDSDVRKEDALTGRTVFRAKGCAACAGEGYSGRLGIYEMIVTNGAIREMIHARRREAEIHAAAIGAGSSLRDHALARVLAGEISVAEMARMTPRDRH